MKYNLYSFLICLVLFSCKGKENTTTNNPSISKVTEAMEKLPPTSTGWNIAPCKLIDEAYLRAHLQIEGSTIAILPDVSTGTQPISSCTYRWTKPNAGKILADNAILQAESTKNKKPFIAESPVGNINISYTGKYADADAAALMMENTYGKIPKNVIQPIADIGNKAIWNTQTNQLIVQKDAYVFYVQMYVDNKKNIDYAKQLAIDVCKKI